jgi:hypothetical protein
MDAGMNKAEIRADLLSLMGEVSPMLVIPDESIADAILWAQDEMAAKTGCTYVETPNITVTDGVALLPETIMKPVRIWWSDYVAPETDPVLWSINDSTVGSELWPYPATEATPNAAMKYQFTPPASYTPIDFEWWAIPFGFISTAQSVEIGLVPTGIWDGSKITVGIVPEVFEIKSIYTDLPSGDPPYPTVNTDVLFVLDTWENPPPFAGGPAWFRIVQVEDPIWGSFYGSGKYVDFTIRISRILYVDFVEVQENIDVPFRLFCDAL